MTHRARLPAPRAFPALQRGSCLPAEPHTARVEPVLAGVAANHAAAAAAAATRVLVPGVRQTQYSSSPSCGQDVGGQKDMSAGYRRYSTF